MIQDIKSIATTSLFVLVTLMTSPVTVAAIPLAGDILTNEAVVDFVLGGVQQDQITANTVITIDAKLNLSVINQDPPISVSPGQSNAALKFTVTNLSNSTNDILLDARLASADASGQANTYTNFTDSDHEVFVDLNDNGIYDPAIDTARFIDDLAPNADITVFVITDIPSDITPGEVAAVALIAQIADSNGTPITNDDSGHISPAGSFENGTSTVAGTPSSSNKNTNVSSILTVFADGAGDIASNGNPDTLSNGQFSDANGYVFEASPALLVKSASPIDCTTRAIDNSIPNNEVYSGICLRYTLTASATDSDIQNIQISDDIPTGTTYMTSSLTLDGISISDALDGDTGHISGVSIEFNIPMINLGDSKEIQFDVTVL